MTPSEQAEALARKCAAMLAEKNGYSFRLGNCDEPTPANELGCVTSEILKSIPLVEVFELLAAKEAENHPEGGSHLAALESADDLEECTSDVFERLKTALREKGISL